MNAKVLTRALLLGIEPRGKDATGFAYRDRTGLVQVHKAPISATSLVYSKRFGMPKRARTAIMHTRFATQGAPSFNGNNHPIVSGNIVGVHNGVVYNDYSIFRQLGDNFRNADVDSEAIFALMAYAGKTDEYLALEDISGPAAVAWLNSNDEPDTLHVARASSNPLWIGLTQGGSMIFASTEHAVKQGAYFGRMELMRLGEVNEGHYFSFQNGIDVRSASFKVRSSYSYSYRGSRSFNDDYEWVTSSKGTISKVSTGGYRGGKAVVPSTPNPIASRTLSNGGEISLVDEIEDAEIVADPANNIVDGIPVGQELPRPPVVAVGGFVDLTKAFDDGVNLSVTAERWNSLYADREDAINDYILAAVNNAECDEEVAAVDQECIWRFHMAIRPGDIVETSIWGQPVAGEVVSCPMSFPDGLYTLRIWVPLFDEPNAPVEVVLVQREAYEFSTTRNVSSPEESTSTPKGE